MALSCPPVHPFVLICFLQPRIDLIRSDSHFEGWFPWIRDPISILTLYQTTPPRLFACTTTVLLLKHSIPALVFLLFAH